MVFWLWKGNHRTAGAWIFQMTNVAHAYFWHIWLPQGNKTLLMQGDHLLSVAGVSEQAGSVCTHSLAHTHTNTHARHTETDTHMRTQADRSTHSHTAGGVRRQRDTCAHTCTNSWIRWEHAQQTGSKLLYKLNTPFLIQCVCQMRCKSRAVGVTGNAHAFYASHKYLGLSPRGSWSGIICS